MDQNVEADGLHYHVQTEDVEDRCEVVTQVFMDGKVLHTYRLPYTEWKAETGWEAKVEEQAKKQHTLMVAAVMRGRLKPESG